MHSLCAQTDQQCAAVVADVAAKLYERRLSGASDWSHLDAKCGGPATLAAFVASLDSQTEHHFDGLPPQLQHHLRAVPARSVVRIGTARRSLVINSVVAHNVSLSPAAASAPAPSQQGDASALAEIRREMAELRALLLQSVRGPVAPAAEP
jgi:hypothetical protein